MQIRHFLKKPETVDAIQFVGGLDSVQEIRTWLGRSVTKVEYRKGVEPMVHDSGAWMVEGIQELLTLTLKSEKNLYALPNHWVVLYPDGRMAIYTDEHIQSKFIDEDKEH